ncbi:hypothetical protein HMPREF0971_00813 [Segatella oris F0302]|uniref:Uncharacterized protein n=1 Tax=Segatella oris F0302 TaxID=649760 RepID=D1QPC3_9BACT|nr:hypothetical protein HMPREF0971_00813 [Segatella oris F0302]
MKQSVGDISVGDNSNLTTGADSLSLASNASLSPCHDVACKDTNNLAN